MANTYRDGVGVERCVACGSALRSKDGAIIAPMRVDEIEDIAATLLEIGDLLSRCQLVMQRAAGRNAEQIRRAKAEAKTGRRETETDVPLPFAAE